MDRFWGALLLLSLATAAPLEPPRSIQDALPQVVAIYNQGPRVQNAFRVLEAVALPVQNSSSVTVQQLNFTIQETVCPASKKVNAEECDFKPDGLVKDCSAYFSTEQENSMIVITCDAAAQEPTRVTRFRFLGGFLRGFRRGFRWGYNQ